MIIYLSFYQREMCEVQITFRRSGVFFIGGEKKVGAVRKWKGKLQYKRKRISPGVRRLIRCFSGLASLEGNFYRQRRIFTAAVRRFHVSGLRLYVVRFVWMLHSSLGKPAYTIVFGVTFCYVHPRPFSIPALSPICSRHRTASLGSLFPIVRMSFE